MLVIGTPTGAAARPWLDDEHPTAATIVNAANAAVLRECAVTVPLSARAAAPAALLTSTTHNGERLTRPGIRS
jgi:hypothetical protein